MKYNERISDYNSENQKSKDFQRIGNIVFNKGVSNDETKAAWLRFKDYVKRLEVTIEGGYERTRVIGVEIVSKS
jgi:hypothetical protein